MRVRVKDFKVHSSFDKAFKDYTEIKGLNGAGKSSVLDAITIALFGKTIYGGSQFTKFVKSGEQEAIVEVFIDNVRFKKIIKAGGSPNGTEFFINDEPKTADDFTRYFGDKMSLSLGAVSPSYFLSLPDSKKRELVSAVVPRADEQEIFNKHFEPRLWSVYKRFTKSQIKKQIENLTLNSHSYNGRLKDAESHLYDTDNQLATMRSMVLPDKEFKALQAMHLKADNELLNKFTKMLSDVHAQYPIYKSLSDQLDLTTAKLKEVVTEVKNIIGDGWVEGVKIMDQAATLEAKLAVDRDKIQKASFHFENQKKLVSGTCPTCGQAVTNPPVMDEIVTKENSLMRVKSDIADKLIVLSNARSAINRNVSIIEELKVKIAQSKAVLDTEGEAEAGLEEVKKSQGVDVVALQKYEEHIRAQSTVSSLMEAREKFFFEHEDYKSRLEKILKEIEDLKAVEKAYNADGVALLSLVDGFKEFNTKLKKYDRNLKLEMIEKNKTTSGYKEAFMCSYEDVPLEQLSYGQRLVVASIFSSVINDYLGREDLKFLLLDEASVLSLNSLRKIKAMCKETGKSLILTRVDESSKLLVVTREWDKVNTRTKLG